MQGDRFGEVVRLRPKSRRGPLVVVRFDRSGREISISPSCIGEIL
jgi:hypothetical protein